MFSQPYEERVNIVLPMENAQNGAAAPPADDSVSHGSGDNGADFDIKGYPQLAKFQSKFPEYTIFAKFSTLNMLNLLHLQAELKHAELRLDTAMKDDFESNGPNRKCYHANWGLLSSSAANQAVKASPCCE